jgi:hypothetical protein
MNTFYPYDPEIAKKARSYSVYYMYYLRGYWDARYGKEARCSGANSHRQLAYMYGWLKGKEVRKKALGVGILLNDDDWI